MSNRLNKLFNKYNKQLVKHTDKTNELFSNIVACDITKGKYVEFILKCYLNKTIQENDLVGGLESTVGKTLALFHKNKKFLEPENRSLNKYKTVGDLWKVVKEFSEKKSSHEIKKEYREKINKETKFIIDKDFKILSPLTKESAQFWGKGTRWCTSAEKNNMFDEYNKKNPLYIVVLPNGHKFQLWNYKSRYKAMDEGDNLLNKKNIENNWEYFKHIKKLLHIALVPKEKIDKDIALEAIKKNALFLKSVPDELKTKEICEIAVKNDGYALIFVPEELKTPELCEQAIEKNGCVLQYVPEKLKIPELCKIAIKNDSLALKYIDYELLTNELCEIAVKNNGYALEFIPEELKTPELCEYAVKNDSLALKYIDYELLTNELCEIAVKNNGYALEFVPEELKTPELCKIAVEQNGNAIQHVPEKLITKELCECAVEKNSYALFFVPEKLRTKEMFELADKNNMKPLIINYGFKVSF